MKPVNDLILLSSIVNIMEENIFDNTKVMRIMNYMKTIGKIYKKGGIEALSQHTTPSFVFDYHDWFNAYLCGFTCLFLFILILSSFCHSKKNILIVRLAPFFLLTLGYMITILKYMMYIEQPVKDILDVFVCLILGLVIGTLITFLNNFSIKSFILSLMANNFYQIIYCLTDSTLVFYFPLIFFCFFASYKTDWIGMRCVYFGLLINILGMILNPFMIINYTPLFHFFNIPILFAIWYAFICDQESLQKSKTD